MSINTVLSLSKILVLCLISLPHLTSAQPRGRQNQMRALAQLKRSNTKAEVSFRSETNTPRAIYGFKTTPYQGSSRVAIARNFLRDYSDLLEVRSEKINLRFLKDLYHEGTHHISFQQVYQGKRVLGAILQVSITDDNEVTSFTGRHYRDIDVDDGPIIPTQSAIQFAESLFMLTGENIVSSSAELVVRRQLKRFSWAYLVSVGSKRVIIDAKSGLLIKISTDRTGLSEELVRPYYTDQDSPPAAISSLGCTNTNIGNVYLSNPTDPLTGSGFTSSVILNRLCGDGKTLDGDYARVFNDHLNPIGAGIPTNTTGTFDFLPQTSTVAAPCPSPAGEARANHDCSHIDDVNVYYHLDKVAHEFWKTQLGFDPPKVDAVVHIGSNGSLGQAIIFNSKINFQHEMDDIDGAIFHDAAKFRQTIYHEYAHHVTFQAGLHYAGTAGVETDALSEGYADYFASSFTNDPVLGEGIVRCPVNLLTNDFACDGSEFTHLRTLNPPQMWTYADRTTLTYGRCESQVYKSPNPPFCSTAILANVGSSHTIGMIWAAGLWALRGEIQSRFPGDNAPAVVDQLALKSIMFVPGNEIEFQDALVGLIIADQTVFDGKYYDSIVEVMRTQRGIGDGGIHGPTIIVTLPGTNLSQINGGVFEGQDIIIEPGMSAIVEGNPIVLNPRTETIHDEAGNVLGTLTHPSSIFILGDGQNRGQLTLNADVICGADSEIIASAGDLIGSEKYQLSCDNACIVAENGGTVTQNAGSEHTVGQNAFLAVDNGTYILGSNATLTYANTSKDLLVAPGSVFELGLNARISLEYPVSFIGSSTNPIVVKRNNSSLQWDYINLVADGNRFEWVTFDGGNKTIEVLSKNNVFDNITVTNGWRGISSGFAVSGGRSSFTLTNSTIDNASSVGLVAYNTDFSVDNSVIKNSGEAGVWLTNATSLSFTNNVVENNADVATTRSGVEVNSGGWFEMDDLSKNTIQNNAFHEILATSSGQVRAGTYLGPCGGGGGAKSSFLPGGSCGGGGYNNIIDSGSPDPNEKLVQNNSSYSIMAEKNYWGGTPQSSQFGGGTVDYTPYLSTQQSKSGIEPPIASLREQIQRVRDRVQNETLEADASDVAGLYSLQQLDRVDSLGERAWTMQVISDLINRRIHAGDNASVILRSAAERAMLVEIQDALGNERYSEARQGITFYDSYVSSRKERIELLMSRIAILSEAGSFREALSTAGEVRRLSQNKDGMEAVLDIVEGELIDRIEDETGVRVAATQVISGSKGSGDASNDPVSANGETGLLAIYPNPFNPTTIVPFRLSEPGHVLVEVFDVLGRRVRTLANGAFEAGRQSIVFDAGSLSSGIYVVRLDMTDGGGKRMSSSQTVTIQK